MIRRLFSHSNTKIILLCTSFVVVQLLYVFAYKPYAVVGDELVYKQLAMEVFQHKPVSTFHYPILYPALLAMGLLFKESFYAAMLIINILFKGLCLYFIYRLMIPICNEKRAVIGVIVLAVSPIYFVYSRLLLAENMCAPLLIITVLYHVVYRGRILNNKAQSIIYTLGGAVLALSIFWTKYLALVLLPVFCLYWCGVHLTEKEDKRKYWLFVRDGAIYTATVLVLIVLYAVIYAIWTKRPLTFKLIKETMGFTSGTGPENVGYVFLPQLKWLISYFLYALLDCGLILVGIICNTSKKILEKYKGMIIFFLFFIATLIYVAARHSTLAPYNEGGIMIKLLGRYVSYATPLVIILWASISDYTLDKSKRGLLAIAVGLAATWIPYLILYRRVLWNPERNWLDACRGLENIDFLEGGIVICILYCVCVVCLVKLKKMLTVLVFCVTMMINNIVAICTYEQNNDAMRYARVMDYFLKDHKYQDISLLCNESLNYVNAMQLTGFYLIDDNYSNIWTIPIVYGEAPVFIDESRANYFMLNSAEVSQQDWQNKGVIYEGNMADGVVFLNWNDNHFAEVERAVSISNDSENGAIISFEGDRNVILVFKNMVWPATCQDDSVKVYLSEVDLVDGEENIIKIYDLANMEVSQEIVIN